MLEESTPTTVETTQEPTPEIADGPARDVEPQGPSAVVPIPGSLRQDKPSFWRRIRLRGRSGLTAATGDDRMLARLDAIESRLETSEHEIGDRIQKLDERFTEVWEVEEQLSRMMELHDMLADVQERQGRIDGRLRGLQRRLSFISILAATAAAAGIVVILLSFL
jgi:hypothetical protein